MTLAVDIDAVTCEVSLTSQRHRGALRRRCCARDARHVVTEHPDVIWATSPCTDFSPAGARVEGVAAECTVHAAKIIAAAQPSVALFENVPAMLASDA